MTVVFLARKGTAANYIVSRVKKQIEIKILFERGQKARRRKLIRYFKWRQFYLWPLRILDVLAIIIYNYYINRAIDKAFPESASTIDSELCDDVNDSDAIAFLKKWKPDLVIVYGTAILNRSTISLCSTFLNLHGGIVPSYRNVHCEFWAMLENRKDLIGTSVLFLTSGIDEGDVAFQARVLEQDLISVRSAIISNIHLAADSAIEAIDLFRNGKLERRSQSNIGGRIGKSTTPTCFEILTALFSKKLRI